jgi:hypothetical protein
MTFSTAPAGDEAYREERRGGVHDVFTAILSCSLLNNMSYCLVFIFGTEFENNRV